MDFEVRNELVVMLQEDETAVIMAAQAVATNDKLQESNLMTVEQHQTLAARDAYASRGGWLSGRSAKVITYHDKYGEVGRSTINFEMIG